MAHTFIDGECDLPMFAAARARKSDPPQCHEAARRAPVRGHCAVILAAFAAGPAGQSEIVRRTGLSVAQVSKRLPDLRDKGLIERDGDAVSASGGREASYRRCDG
jgi:predicted Rossmann fold nucleotide-binding protein DprA/Smf involved in DNA uptake